MADRSPSKVLITSEQIQSRIAELAAEIRRDYPENVHIIAVLKGAFVFMADLIRHIEGNVSIDFMAVSSYAKGTTTSGEVRLLKDLDTALDGKDVLIVEDIVDTGLTMRYLLDNLATRRPASIKLCSLLHKPARTQQKVPIDYLGFTIEDLFVVGYGLDYAQRFRDMPDIAVLNQPEPAA